MSMITNALGLRFVLDTMLIDNPSGPMAALRELHRAGFIELVRTDVMDTELSTCRDPERRATLLSLSGELVEHLGVMVWGHSRLGFAVWGSDEDSRTWDRVWQTLWPERDRTAESSRSYVRDAMNVWTAMRYGANAFVTLDGSGKDRGLLDRAEAVRQAFDDFAILTPAQALAFAERMKARWRLRTSQSA